MLDRRAVLGVKLAEARRVRLGGRKDLDRRGIGALEVGRTIEVDLAVLNVRHPDLAVDRRRASLINEEAPIFAGTAGRGDDGLGRS